MIDFPIGFGLEKGSGMAIRIGFVVREGREHPQWRNLPIPSRIPGPDVIILSRNRFLKKPFVQGGQITNRHAPNDRKDMQGLWGKIFVSAKTMICDGISTTSNLTCSRQAFHENHCGSLTMINSCFSWKASTVAVLYN